MNQATTLTPDLPDTLETLPDPALAFTPGGVKARAEDDNDDDGNGPVRTLPAYADMPFNPTSERLVQILMQQTRNRNQTFFRVVVGYYMAVVASMMRTSVDMKGKGKIPVNLYALALSGSGTGKTRSMNIMEHQVTHLFRQRFLNTVFPQLAASNIPKEACKRASAKATDPEAEELRLTKEFEGLGKLFFSFDSGTPAAIKQVRQKLLIAGGGALNLQMDEVGDEMMGNMEMILTLVQLYDVGMIKPKLIKSTAENVRYDDMEGGTPANMMLFGSPLKLFDGQRTEEALNSMMANGIARRCFFAYNRKAVMNSALTPSQVYDMENDRSNDTYLRGLSQRLGNMADYMNVGRVLTMSKDTLLALNEYQLDCERRAELMREIDTVKQQEMVHRYYKVAKLAGAYAFIEDTHEVTRDHLYQAIAVAEDCGNAFEDMMMRDRPHAKLAKYIASANEDLTLPDLSEDLPFFKGGASTKNDYLDSAIAWGYQNNIIIKKHYEDSILFLRGETLKETDLQAMPVSWSDDVAVGYRPDNAPFDKLHLLTQVQGLHFINHHLSGGRRNEQNCIPGFSMIVLDVDGQCQMSTARLLLGNYKYLMHTTKSHTEAENRFRIILPVNYELKLNAEDYKEFMQNIFEALPFDSDDQTGQRARKWNCHNGHYEYNEAGTELFDVLPFIPKTRKNDRRKATLHTQGSMDNLERWVMRNIGDGNRNNMLLRYAMILVDAGFDLAAIEERVAGLNSKIADKLSDAEIAGTIMVSAKRAIDRR